MATGRFVLDIGSGEMILRVGRLLPCSRPTRSGSVMIRAFAWSPPPRAALVRLVTRLVTPGTSRSISGQTDGR